MYFFLYLKRNPSIEPNDVEIRQIFSNAGTNPPQTNRNKSNTKPALRT